MSGKFNYSLGESNTHYRSPILSIPIIKIIDKKYTNPLNLIFELYFSSFTRICDDIRCKNGIISHINTTYYNNFDFSTFLIFLVNTYDVKALRDNGKRIKSLFNQIIILDSIEYRVIAYYLMPYENHFVIIFQSQLSIENIKFIGGIYMMI